MYLTKSKHLAADQDNRLFVHWNKKQLRSSHISKWLVDTIQLAYESASADSKKLEGVKGHQVRSLASSWAYFRKLPLEEVRKAVGWKSRTVFSSHYLKDVQQDEEVTGPLPVVLAGNALLLKALMSIAYFVEITSQQSPSAFLLGVNSGILAKSAFGTVEWYNC